ncbi:hypothetical protein A2U01_0118384, partial [Trifolium medium]|nr:hypothetical protein [Trifolium medium]
IVGYWVVAFSLAFPSSKSSCRPPCSVAVSDVWCGV